MRRTDDQTILRMKVEGKTGKQIADHFGVSPAYICKRVKRLQPVKEPESFGNLTIKQRRFVLAKGEGKSDTQAALEVFDVTNRDSAKTIGHKLTQDPDIKLALSDLMAVEGLTRRHRVQRLKEAINHPDKNVSLKGLDQSWKLEGLYGVEPPPIHVNFNALMIEAEALDKEIKRLEAELAKVRRTPEGMKESHGENYRPK